MAETLTGEHGVGLLKRDWLLPELGEVSMDVHRIIKGTAHVLVDSWG
ncbi:FAD-linked oxidase C-terminal domain-containing protein [Arthrobacter subterraneus]